MAGAVDSIDSDDSASQDKTDNLQTKDIDRDLNLPEESVSKKSTCSSSNEGSSMKISTDVREVADTKVTQWLPSCETPSNGTGEESQEPVLPCHEGSKSAGSKFSRGGKSRRGGRGNNKKANVENLDFHSALFSSLQNNCNGNANIPVVASSSTAKLNNGINEGVKVEPGYLTRDTMIQLTANINNGFFYINNALELLKQSQTELFQAKYTLERMYRSQHGDLDPPGQFEDMGQDMENGEMKIEVSSHNGHSSILENCSEVNVGTATASTSQVERFQLNLDPFQFIDAGCSTATRGRTVGRGLGARRGRGTGRGGRIGQRRTKEMKTFRSNYNSELSHKDLKSILKQLPLPVDCNIVDNQQPMVILYDLLPILKKKGQCKPNLYSAAKIEALYKRHLPTALKKMKFTNQMDQMSPEQNSMENDPAEDEFKTSKQVSKLTYPPASEENGDSSERKTPVTTNSSSAGSDQSSKGVKKLPHWRSLRVDPEILARIKKRVHDELDQKAKLRLEALESQSTSNVQTEVKPSTSSCMGFPQKKFSIEKISTHSSTTNSTTSGRATPPDEDMIDLTLGEYNMDEDDVVNVDQENVMAERDEEEDQFQHDLRLAIQRSLTDL